MALRVPAELDLSSIVTQPLESGSGYTWTLASRLGQMLRELEEQFGERDKSYTILGIEFIDGIPQVWYPSGGRNVVIQLNLECLSESHRACYQLAHEAVHLLSPTGGNNGTCLEEGLATTYSSAYMLRYFSDPWHANMPSYQNAASAVETLLAGRPTIIKTLRQSEPVISKISSQLILSVCPEFDPGLAEYLCSPFVRE